MRYWHSSIVLLLISLLPASMISCSWHIGDVPPPLRVDTGMDPDMQDKYTRFRTTYYFRIVDACAVDADTVTENGKENSYDNRLGVFRVRTKGKLRIINDSLYRFRMTGKASALFSKVYFESGVLSADQIDPFGSKVEYDTTDGIYKVKSTEAIRRRDLRLALVDEIKELNKLYDSFADKSTGKEVFAAIKQDLEIGIKQKVRLLAGEGSAGFIPSEPHTEPNAGLPDVRCPDGRPSKKSYFLYGPEGVRQLDPDERLIMAMTSDSKPLVGVLQRLSGLKSKNINPSTTDIHGLLTEQSWQFDAARELSSAQVNLTSPDQSLSLQPSTAELVQRLLNSRPGKSVP